MDFPNKLHSFASSPPQLWLYVWEVKTQETTRARRVSLGSAAAAEQAEMHRRRWPGSNMYHALWLQYTISTIYMWFFYYFVFCFFGGMCLCVCSDQRYFFLLSIAQVQFRVSQYFAQSVHITQHEHQVKEKAKKPFRYFDFEPLLKGLKFSN